MLSPLFGRNLWHWPPLSRSLCVPCTGTAGSSDLRQLLQHTQKEAFLLQKITQMGGLFSPCLIIEYSFSISYFLLQSWCCVASLTCTAFLILGVARDGKAERGLLLLLSFLAGLIDFLAIPTMAGFHAAAAAWAVRVCLSVWERSGDWKEERKLPRVVVLPPPPPLLPVGGTGNGEAYFRLKRLRLALHSTIPVLYHIPWVRLACSIKHYTYLVSYLFTYCTYMILV